MTLTEQEYMDTRAAFVSSFRRVLDQIAELDRQWLEQAPVKVGDKVELLFDVAVLKKSEGHIFRYSFVDVEEVWVPVYIGGVEMITPPRYRYEFRPVLKDGSMGKRRVVAAAYKDMRKC